MSDEINDNDLENFSGSFIRPGISNKPAKDTTCDDKFLDKYSSCIHCKVEMSKK